MAYIFIFEGPDYTGKSSCVKYCEEELKKNYTDREIKVIRSPGGTPFGEKIRDIARVEAKGLIEQSGAFIASLLSVYEYLTSDEVANSKDIILLDRWVYSLLVYQLNDLKGNRISHSLIKLAEDMSRIPSQVFLFDVSFEQLMERIKASDKTEEKDRFENSKEEEKKRILRNYSLLTIPHSMRLHTDRLNLDLCKTLTLTEIIKKVEHI